MYHEARRMVTLRRKARNPRTLRLAANRIAAENIIAANWAYEGVRCSAMDAERHGRDYNPLLDVWVPTIGN